MFRSLKKKISVWWNGEWYKGDFPYIGRIHARSAIRARKVVGFLKRKHEFIIATLLTVIGLLLAFVYQ